MAPRSVFLAAALIGATLVHGSPNPFAMPKAFAQTDSMPECLSDCLLEYGTSTSAQQCFGDIDPDTATMDEQMTVIDCWCTDSSRAGTSLDRCTASCTDGGAEFWESICMSVSGGGGSPPADDEEDPLEEDPLEEDPLEEEESISSTPSRPTRTITTETEEETDFIDVPTDTNDTDSPTVTEDEEPTDTVDDEEEDAPTTTRVRRPTPPAEADDDSSAQQFLPHAGALVAGLFAAVIAL